MYIVHLATELSPIAKVGGLGDVTAGLSKTLVEEGQKVEVILPFYKKIDRKQLKNLKSLGDSFWSAEYDTIPLVLIESPLFQRENIYGEKDDIERFTFFPEAALKYLLKSNKHPDILNLHDWLTSFAAPLYRETYQKKGLKVGAIATTIHNMKYQGVCPPGKLPLKRPSLIKNKKGNLLQAGLMESDVLTTVSPTYAKEIERKEGYGLEEVIKQKKTKGILNGIDTSYWNPETDPLLAENYTLETLTEGKKANRKALQKELKMDYDSAPLFTSISRLVQQKGPELILAGIEYVLKKGGQFILLGSTPDPCLKNQFQSLSEEYRDNPHVHFHFTFNERLAHFTYAAADFILIPSLFEPCGLTQMIALRYGTLPIVHKVGGLSDTIFDIDHEEIPKEKRNGYTFEFPAEDSLRWSIDRAFENHKNNPKKNQLMLQNGIKKDWSWKTPALKYLQTYKEALQAAIHHQL
ncbi:glycogen synthase [Candidatus Neptunochlamydia vexilliferae]|uniref:Glycogen synthase n=1 Tax=Candidatus Neptunichlamydia vexilliferae TaxID=1651774 RepID=A0ABS0AWS6_9BACT|nr:glycogen/starch synthase [Candidatus Neptunochlamydia vexilliferae]MBF5058571.1 Glycogen synthase [Candidatus Neptunochlamydia vexilliferae]